MLAVILILCFLGKKDLVTKYSPWTVFSFIVSGNFKETFSSSLASIIIFGIIIVAMSVEKRFFCRHLCPMGAVFAIVPSGILARRREYIKVKIAFLPVMHAVKTVRLALNPELKKKEVNA